MFRLILWIVVVGCLYTILTTRSVEVISIAGLFGVISTWLLIKADKYLDQIEK
jgi:hypothetical protein